MLKRFSYSLLFSCFLIFGLANSVLAETNEGNKEDSTQEIITTEWIEEDSKESKNQIQNNTKLTQEDSSNSEILIHNNGNPIKNNILSEAGENSLFAIYKIKINGDDYETYYFENSENTKISELKKGIEEDKENIKAKETTNQVTTMVATEPSGGYYRTYNWTFNNDLGNKMGEYSSVNHYDRKSTNANIDGKTGSVWDLKATNTWNATTYAPLSRQVTRIAVPYTNQKLISYGPYDDSGSTVSVSLRGILDPMGWTFDISSFSVNDGSSYASKFGRWIYTRNYGYLDPFVTKPGIRGTNTSGNFGTQLSHDLVIDSESHSTGIVTVYLPDR